MHKSMFSAVADKNSIKIFNLENGARVFTVNVGGSEIVNGPVVTGDRMSFVVKDCHGKLTGKVYSLPRGQLKYTFIAK